MGTNSPLGLKNAIFFCCFVFEVAVNNEISNSQFELKEVSDPVKTSEMTKCVQLYTANLDIKIITD